MADTNVQNEAPHHHEHLHPQQPRRNFAHFASKVSLATGHPYSFAAALILIAVWGASGFVFHFNNTWQLMLETTASILTLLMVLLLQSTQNRHSAAVQIKLNEIIRALGPASNSVLNVEDLAETELKELSKEYRRLGRADRVARKRRGKRPPRSSQSV